MATAETSSAITKRSNLKRLALKLAKLSKGIELTLKDRQSVDKTKALKNEVRQCWDLYAEENEDLSVLPDSDQTEQKNVFDKGRADFETLLKRAND